MMPAKHSEGKQKKKHRGKELVHLEVTSSIFKVITSFALTEDSMLLGIKATTLLHSVSDCGTFKSLKLF